MRGTLNPKKRPGMGNQRHDCHNVVMATAVLHSVVAIAIVDVPRSAAPSLQPAIHKQTSQSDCFWCLTFAGEGKGVLHPRP